MNHLNCQNGLISFLNSSHSTFHALLAIENELKQSGFLELKEDENFNILEKGKYFVKRNDSSIIAFKIPTKLKELSFALTATHNDSPTFKIKPHPVVKRGNCTLLETEPYGGAIYNTWLDRPLTIAGRVVFTRNGQLQKDFLYVDSDLLVIPNLAIHMNRTINKENSYNPAKDMLPLISDESEFDFDKFLKAQLHLTEGDQILSHDLFLANRTKATYIGAEEQFIASPRLDDLASVYCALKGFTEAENEDSIAVFSSFDNEEVGSLTRQGANSTFLKDVLKRIVNSLSDEKDAYLKAISKSFMLSIDNAHADHPNHLEYTALTSPVNLNKGIVIKYSAAQKYTTDSISSAIVKALCLEKGISYQEYTNRSDLPGGSTLGNISNSEVSLCQADIGLAQLAMHSAYELMGANDIQSLVSLTKVHFEKSKALKDALK